ncbi:EF-hand domain-containing protein [Pseudomonas sp. R2.Fl]|nr:EF-hand domain-containing protein [Pseudomonas sp. R2.Fl]
MKTKTLVLAALAASLTLGTSATAFAARENGGPMRPHARAAMFVRMLQEFDTDKNGQISRDEATAAAETVFAAIDADKDGSLTPGELRKHREARIAEWRKEREAARADDQDNGAPQENAQREENDQGPDRWQRGEDGPRYGWGWGPHGDGPRHAWGRDGDGQRPMGGGRLIRQADIDENGQISKPEALAVVDKMFTRADRDKNGAISADDFPKRPVWFR